MPSTEPLGATASSRGVSRLRRNNDGAEANNQNNNQSTSSLPSRASSTTGDDSADPDMRAHMDSALDKVKERTRRSTDERRGSEESASNKRLSALLDRGGRKWKRKEKNTAGNGNTLSVHSGESAGDLALSDHNRSDGSLLDEDGNSSLLTDDGSDIEGYVSECFIACHCLPIIIPCPRAYPCPEVSCQSAYLDTTAQHSTAQHTSAIAALRAERELSERLLVFTL